MPRCFDESSSKRILVLNDHAETLGFLYQTIRYGFGDHHVFVADSLQAMLMLELEPFDLIIQDMVRPDLNGLQVYWLMKTRPNLCHIPQLIISAWSPSPTITELTIDENKHFYKIQFETHRDTLYGHVLDRVANMRDGHTIFVEGYIGNESLYSHEIIKTIKDIFQQAEQQSANSSLQSQVEQLWGQSARTLTNDDVVRWLSEARYCKYINPSDQRPDSLKF